MGLYGVSGTDQSSVEEVAAGHSDWDYTTPPDNEFARCPEFTTQLGKAFELEKWVFAIIKYFRFQNFFEFVGPLYSCIYLKFPFKKGSFE